MTMPLGLLVSIKICTSMAHMGTGGWAPQPIAVHVRCVLIPRDPIREHTPGAVPYVVPHWDLLRMLRYVPQKVTSSTSATKRQVSES